MTQGRMKQPYIYWLFTKRSLKFLSIWPIFDDELPIIQIIHGIQLWLVTVSTIYQIIGMTAMCYMTYTDFISAAESIGPMMGLYVSFGKICLYRHQKKKLANLARLIEDCVNNERCDVYEHFYEFTRIAIMACGSFYCVCIVLSLGYLSYPCLTTERVLPFSVYYPWDWTNSTILYFISYSHEVTITLLLINANATEFTYIWSVCHCCAQLRVIRTELTKFSLDYTERDERKMKKFISSFVQAHSNVLSEIECINGAYTNIVLLLFIAAVVAVCCAGLQLTNTSAKARSTILFSLLAIYFAEQLLLYYLPGDILADQALAIGSAVYSCGWEYLNAKNRQTMIILIMRCNIPIKLRIGNLRALRMENYASFMATTMSYFTSVQAAATR